MLFQDVIQFPTHFGKGKTQALCPDATFFAKLYGGKQMKITSMNELRFQLFTSRKAKAPAIKNLPPTLKHHLMRAHLQTMIWRAADQQGPPADKIRLSVDLDFD